MKILINEIVKPNENRLEFYATVSHEFSEIIGKPRISGLKKRGDIWPNMQLRVF